MATIGRATKRWRIDSTGDPPGAVARDRLVAEATARVPIPPDSNAMGRRLRTARSETWHCEADCRRVRRPGAAKAIIRPAPGRPDRRNSHVADGIARGGIRLKGECDRPKCARLLCKVGSLSLVRVRLGGSAQGGVRIGGVLSS